jgi:hypothetical protein
VVQRAPHEGGIGTRVGEALEVGCVPDPAAGHELGAWERAADLAQQIDVRAGAGSHAGEVEDDERSDPAAPCQLGDGDRGEGAECGVRGVRLTGAEVEGEYGSGGWGRCGAALRRSVRLTGGGTGQPNASDGPPARGESFDLRRQSFECSARIGGRRERLEPHDHPRRAVRQELTSMPGSRDTGVDPDCDVRSLGRNGAPERALRCAARDGIEVGEIELAESQAVMEGASNGQRITWLTGRELRRKWRITVAIARLGVHCSAAEYVQNRDYTHRQAAVIGYHRNALVAK